MHTLAQCRRLAAVLPVAAVAGCGSVATSEPREFPVRFLVSNALIAPVTISIDGAPYAILTGGRSTGLTVSSSARWLTWTSAKTTDAVGRPIPDDIGEVRVRVSGIGGHLEISNVIDDQPYITAWIFNHTKAQASIGVYDGSSVSCAGVLPAASGDAVGIVLIGYYRLRPATEVRAYRDPWRCTGPYVPWPQSQLAAFAAKSGLLSLSLDSAP
jgi:hypothetical protein